MDTVALFSKASQATADIASNVTESQLSSATPCSEFDVSGLLTHMAIVSTRPNITLFETAIHGWDLAKGTGQELQVSNDVGEAIFVIAQRICNDDRRGEGKPFGPEINIEDGASAFEKAVP